MSELTAAQWIEKNLVAVQDRENSKEHWEINSLYTWQDLEDAMNKFAELKKTTKDGNLPIEIVIGFLFNKAVEAHSWYLEEDKELGGDEVIESKDMFKHEMQKELKNLGVKIPDNCL